MKKILSLCFLLLLPSILIVNLFSHPAHASMNRWQTLAPSPGGLILNGMAFDGQRYVYTVGGKTDLSSSGTNRFLRYDIVTNAWDSLPPVPYSMYTTKAFYFQGDLYVLAGAIGSTPVTNFLKYNIATSIWSNLPNVPFNGVVGESGSVFDGSNYIYAFSTTAGTQDFTMRFFRYDIRNNNWVQLPSASIYAGHTVVVADNRGNIYKFGGDSLHGGGGIPINYYNTGEKYDIQSGTWQEIAPAPGVIRFGTGVYDGDDHFYVTNGQDNVYRYSIPEDKWETLPNSPYSFYSNVAVWDNAGGVIMTTGATNGDPTRLYRFATFEITSIDIPTTPTEVNTQITVTGTFRDGDTSQTHTALWNWGDNTSSTGTVTETNGSGSVTGSHIYTHAGVYTITLTVADNNNELEIKTSATYAVIYDPNGGFVTGSGIIISPAGAYTQDTNLAGKANFGFVSKYLHGANVPTGSTQFRFHSANFNFQSTDYQWLVIGGAKGQYKGAGTINNSGNYGFMLTAIDGALPGGGGSDKFRIKIWNTDTGAVVYDNQQGAADTSDPTTVIDSGSIIIHS